jgi:hypothetical protein
MHSAVGRMPADHGTVQWAGCHQSVAWCSGQDATSPWHGAVGRMPPDLEQTFERTASSAACPAAVQAGLPDAAFALIAACREAEVPVEQHNLDTGELQNLFPPAGMPVRRFNSGALLNMGARLCLCGRCRGWLETGSGVGS